MFDPKWRLYPFGFGISGILGWQGGYLCAKAVSKRRTWASVGGLMVLQSYVRQWVAGHQGVGHACHFTTLAQGFIAGLLLERYGPKPKPFKLIKRHVGKFVIAVVLGSFALGPILDYLFPDPPGFVDPQLPT